MKRNPIITEAKKLITSKIREEMNAKEAQTLIDQTIQKQKEIVRIQKLPFINLTITI